MSVDKDEVMGALTYYRAKQIIADDARYMAKGEVANYALPKATNSTLGGVKVGSNIAVNDGTISIPAASTSTLGVVKVGSNISVSDGTISLSASNVTNALGYTPPSTNTTYTAASSTNLGLVKTGANVTVSSAGVIGVPAASSSSLGVVKIGSNLSVNNGTISLSSANVTAALGYTPADQSTVGSSQVTLGTASVSTEGALWLDFS